MKRLLLYVHYNRLGDVAPHVLYQLEQLRPLFDKVMFISNSPVKVQDQERLGVQGLVDDLVQRANQGYDFAAWKEGMEQRGWSSLTDFDSLTIMNDTCFGPLYDLTPWFERFEADQRVDFWGMTNHRRTRRIQEHVQSYFISFKRQVVNSEAFQVFWQGVGLEDDLLEVIDNYEIGLSLALKKAGFRYKVIFDTRWSWTSNLRNPNFTYYEPLKTIKAGLPLVKVKALMVHLDQRTQLLDELARRSSYPVRLITDYLVSQTTDKG